MCLIALAHRASARYPLVIAANRDEDHTRPTRAAHVWDDAEGVVGGRDGLLGGAWLAISRGGRFAAVTNLRGAIPRGKSRGAMVRDFVVSDSAAFDYVSAIDPSEYAGFHLFAGEVNGALAHLSTVPALLDPGIHGVSNAPRGEHWPKVDLAIEAVRSALAFDDVDAIIDGLLHFLATPRGTGAVETEVFIAGDRYGTRASTVIVATADAITFAEQNYGAGGITSGAVRRFEFEVPQR